MNYITVRPAYMSHSVWTTKCYFSRWSIIQHKSASYILFEFSWFIPQPFYFSEWSLYHVGQCAWFKNHVSPSSQHLLWLSRTEPAWCHSTKSAAITLRSFRLPKFLPFSGRGLTRTSTAEWWDPESLTGSISTIPPDLATQLLICC